MQRSTLALFLTLALTLTTIPALADGGFDRPAGPFGALWSWLLEATGLSKIGGATSDPDGPPAPPPAEEGGTAEAPGENIALPQDSHLAPAIGPAITPGADRETTVLLRNHR